MWERAGGREEEGADMEDGKGEVERLVQEKKECWQRYAEEQSWDDVWKLIKFAKDPWRTKESMKDLKGDGRDQCESDNNKPRALVKRNLFIRHQEPLEVRGAEEQRGWGTQPREHQGQMASVIDSHWIQELGGRW